MKTLNSEAKMRTQNQFGADTLTKARARERVALLFLLLAWLALPRQAEAQIDYTDPAAVSNYVSTMLYWNAADPANWTSAAFRYKDLLYTNDTAGIRPDRSRMGTYYGDPERVRAQSAESELLRGLANNATNALLAGLLLDLYYDRTAAELILAGNSLASADQVRMGKPTVSTGFVIDDEINVYQQALTAYRSALMGHLCLLTNRLAAVNMPPAGYQWFRQLVPCRSLTPATWLSNGTPISVTGSTDALFAGYKDLVLLLNGLRDYGRALAPLARLQMERKNPGDVAQASTLIAEGQRFLFLETSTLLALFPALQDTNVVDAASGLAEAMAGATQSLSELQGLGQTIRTDGNPLGFDNDFLMLVQKSVAQSTNNIFDSFDSFQSQLDPGQLSSPLGYAKTLLDQANAAYAAYREYQDDLQSQLSDLTGSAEDRLFQIVGARPGTPQYQWPTNNPGSEISQQLTSIRVAQLRINKNSAEIANLEQQVQIVLKKANSLNDSWVQYGEDQARLSDQIDTYKAAQVAADKFADAMGSIADFFKKPEKLITFGVELANAGVQTGLEGAIGDLERQKEEMEASQQGQVALIEGRAEVETLRLNFNTLAIDSQEAVALLGQEVGRLVALWREKTDLENTLSENQRDLAARYFADPIHHLRYLNETMLASLAFDEAQKWLFFMARALEYKWNTPFMNYFYMGKRWSTTTLFKLRNADELIQFYNAMVSFNSLIQLPSDDYQDWFSVREDFFGYKM
ncbi:MAG TPA: hypothetical protein VMT24_17320, partial [Aggregatilineaceae bacterium]|nr:hypothetical protein [Aggregatilineaceae bacterium]